MAQIIPFPADAEESSLESLSREELLALAQELREKLAALDAREPEDMMSKAYERWGERHEALEDELDPYVRTKWHRHNPHGDTSSSY